MANLPWPMFPPLCVRRSSPTVPHRVIQLLRFFRSIFESPRFPGWILRFGGFTRICGGRQKALRDTQATERENARRERDSIVRSLFAPLSPHASDEELLRLRSHSQSLAYYSDLSRYISDFFLAFETLSLLDIVPRAWIGLAFLRLMHHPMAFTRLKFDPVWGFDTDPDRELSGKTAYPDLHTMSGDILQLQPRSFDIVICNNLTDVGAPIKPILQHLLTIPRRALFISVCTIETDPSSPAFRANVEAVVRELRFDDVRSYDSNHWHGGVRLLGYKNVMGTSHGQA